MEQREIDHRGLSPVAAGFANGRERSKMSGSDLKPKSGLRALLVSTTMLVSVLSVPAKSQVADARDDLTPTGQCGRFGTDQPGYPEPECVLMRKRWASYLANRGIPCNQLLSIDQDSQSPLVRVTCRRPNAPPYTISNPPFEITSFAGTTDAGQPRGEVAQINSEEQWNRILNMTRAVWRNN